MKKPAPKPKPTAARQRKNGKAVVSGPLKKLERPRRAGVARSLGPLMTGLAALRVGEALKVSGVGHNAVQQQICRYKRANPGTKFATAKLLDGSIGVWRDA